MYWEFSKLGEEGKGLWIILCCESQTGERKSHLLEEKKYITSVNFTVYLVLTVKKQNQQKQNQNDVKMVVFSLNTNKTQSHIECGLCHTSNSAFGI